MADTDRDQEQRRKECLRKSGTLLSQRDYTCMRLRDKLLAGGFEEEIVEMTLKDLKEAHYLDEPQGSSARRTRSAGTARRSGRCASL